MSSPNTSPSNGSAPGRATSLSRQLPSPPDEPADRALTRVRWLRRWLDALGERPVSVLDFGCGNGATTPYFFDELRVRSLIGVEVSLEQLADARQSRSCAGATYVQLGDYRATESIDLAYAHGLFHELPTQARMAAAVLVYRSLKPGGLFAFWEENPWNPAARLGIGRNASGNGAERMNPPQARQLLRGVGFDIVATTSAFYFPATLSWLRPIELMLAPIPLGGEYMVLARKP